MTPGALLARAARETLAAGPMSWTERREDHVRYLDETFGDGRALLSGIASTHPSSTCAVCVGMWAMLAGIQPKRRPPLARAITTWAGFGGFASRYWVPVAELVPEEGDVPYFCGDHPKGWQAATDGHVGVLLEGEGWHWVTAEGGGGADGTTCRMSAAPKDIRTHGRRKLRGAWRPGGRPGSAPPPPPKSDPPAPKPQPPSPDASLARGIDVSHHQVPSAINWTELARNHVFVYARATYGVRADKHFAEHARRAQDAGLLLGAYAFYRAGEDPIDQADAFRTATDPVKPALAPVIDVEQNEKFDGPVTPDRYLGAEVLAEQLREMYGSLVLYTNPSMWPVIGNPDWARDCHLWIAHYGVKDPRAVLGMQWDLWQHRVAPLPGVFSGPIDQNVAKKLVLLGEPPKVPETPAVLFDLDFDEDEYRKLRDDVVRGGGEPGAW